MGSVRLTLEKEGWTWRGQSKVSRSITRTRHRHAHSKGILQGTRSPHYAPGDGTLEELSSDVEASLALLLWRRLISLIGNQYSLSSVQKSGVTFWGLVTVNMADYCISPRLSCEFFRDLSVESLNTICLFVYLFVYSHFIFYCKSRFRFFVLIFGKSPRGSIFSPCALDQNRWNFFLLPSQRRSNWLVLHL